MPSTHERTPRRFWRDIIPVVAAREALDRQPIESEPWKRLAPGSSSQENG